VLFFQGAKNLAPRWPSLGTIPQASTMDAEKSQVIVNQQAEYGFCYLTGAFD
jgi:hypothetical protein